MGPSSVSWLVGGVGVWLAWRHLQRLRKKHFSPQKINSLMGSRVRAQEWAGAITSCRASQHMFYVAALLDVLRFATGELLGQKEPESVTSELRAEFAKAWVAQRERLRASRLAEFRALAFLLPLLVLPRALLPEPPWHLWILLVVPGLALVAAAERTMQRIEKESHAAFELLCPTLTHALCTAPKDSFPDKTPGPVALTLFIYEKWLPTRRAIFKKASITLGDAAQADVVLRTPGLTQLHFVIHNAGEQDLKLVALGNTAGATLNGAPVPAEQALHDGDELVLGKVGIVVKVGALWHTDPPRRRSGAA